ncbi:hypothetical protein ACLB2K_046777 [Fragaria x ananassa]
MRQSLFRLLITILKTRTVSLSRFMFCRLNGARKRFMRDSKGGKERYMRGTVDNGLQKVHMPVFAWKVDLFSVKPVISVLSQNNKWIVLQRPRKSFERIIKSILVTLHSLSYVIRNPQTSAKSMWE